MDMEEVEILVVPGKILCWYMVGGAGTVQTLGLDHPLIRGPPTST